MPHAAPFGSVRQAPGGAAPLLASVRFRHKRVKKPHGDVSMLRLRGNKRVGFGLLRRLARRVDPIVTGSPPHASLRVLPGQTHEGLRSYAWGPFGEGTGAKTLRNPATGGVS